MDKLVIAAAVGLSSLASAPAMADVFEVGKGGAYLAKTHTADVFPLLSDGLRGAPGPSAAPAPSPPRELESVFDAAAARFDLSPTFLRLVAWQESRFRTDAVSTAGAIGIMQLMPNTAAELGVDPKNARDNIFGGAAYLRQMLDRFGGRIDLALAAYNAGPTRVAQIQATPAIAETQGYVAELLDRLAQNASTFAGTTPLSSLEKGALP